MSASPPPLPEEAPERETSSVELLWDLVFVFAVTQVTTLLAASPSWGRFAQSMLVLALIWWAWSAFVWASNALEADSRLLRAYLLLGTVLIIISLGESIVSVGVGVADSEHPLSVALAGAVRRLNSAPAWTVGAGVTVLIVGLCALESLAEYRSSREAGEAPGAPVAASPTSQAAARVADPDHGLE